MRPEVESLHLIWPRTHNKTARRDFEAQLGAPVKKWRVNRDECGYPTIFGRRGSVQVSSSGLLSVTYVLRDREEHNYVPVDQLAEACRKVRARKRQTSSPEAIMKTRERFMLVRNAGKKGVSTT